MAVNTNPGNMGIPMIASLQRGLNERFQAGLAADGRHDPRMKNIVADLFRKNAGMARTFKKGDNDKAVYLLQSALYLNGYNLHLNGSYDAATEAAVRAFQRGKGLVETGVMDPAGLKALFPDPAPAPSVRPMPLPAKPVPAPMPRIAPAPVRPIPAPVKPMPLPAPVPAPVKPMPLPAPIPAPVKPMPLPAPIPAPVKPMPLPAPVPAPVKPMPLPAPVPKPAEYVIRLNARNPEAVIKVQYEK